MMTMLRHLGLLSLLFFAGCAARPGAPISPGMNFFSKQQDIEMGNQAAQEVLQQMDVVKDPFLQEYVNKLGQRLANSDDPAKSEFPFKFTVLNDPSVNAFALPGGPMFVFTGLMASARTEGELAGVLGHEMAHVVLRHGTNQVSKANLLQIPAAVAQVGLADGSAVGQLAQIGVGFGLSSLLLKFSRTAETQADRMGARIIAQAGIDPLEMAKFFEVLEAESGQRGSEFFASHPNPGNRRTTIQAEAAVMPVREYGYQTGEFERMKEALKRLPPPVKKPAQPQAQAQALRAAAPAPAASAWRQLNAGGLQTAYPGNWVTVRGNSNMIAVAPREGLARDINGNVAVGYGVILSYYRPRSRNLMGATQELAQQLAAADPSLQQTGQLQQLQVQGRPGLAATFAGRSAFGGTEEKMLITVARPEGLFYLMSSAPTQYAPQMRQIAQQMVQSLSFRN